MHEHLDVLIIGAGISGIGAAAHLQAQCPDKSFAVLEAHEGFGGTWLIHRYPGIRSDSDLFTFGYRFKPWTGPPIATGAEIMRYLGEVIQDHGLATHIRYRRKVIAANWTAAQALWTVTVENGETGETEVLTTGFLWMCQGYYRHDHGYRPDWPGLGDYRGTLVHPQNWPADTDLSGKRVIIIGSGATAATLAPNIASKCGDLTLLQRSPTYFYVDANRNELAETLRMLDVDPAWIHEIVRRKILHEQRILTQLALAFPEEAKKQLLQGVRDQLGPDFDIETHFTPRYRPWQQRIAFIPDGDFFKAVKSGKLEVVTDHIERFTPTGILLTSGRELEADVVITATGFNLSVLGDIAFTTDDTPIDASSAVTWRGLMVTGMANLVWTFGYFRASWTLRVDLIGDFVCRLLKHMDARGARSVMPMLPADTSAADLESWITGQDFAPSYMQRGAALLPKRGPGQEWTHTQDYWTEKDELPKLNLDACALQFE